ncbi:mediator of RNA polymerase II transcription subunit 26 [Misgurnus anguillicaudatus]|uniref:mediator of RNA polymerase II transcription subunit 26 n=1 Tax=Misgurnus anguillicaudatus TaxID=75329 RepID=UPI003CCFDFD6
MTMRRSLSRAQQLREQLLQAIDSQYNIHNMAVVLDVIYCLEKYPMTKEALMETRLGKLINDVRKRSTDEDLVKRLKSLVRSCQNLAAENEATEKDPDTSISIRAKLVSRSTQTFVHSINQRADKSDCSAPDKTMNYPTRVRRSKIPVRAVNPYSSSHISTKQCSASMSLRTSLSNQPSQDHIVRYLHMHESQKHRVFSSQCSHRNLFVIEEPTLSTSTVSKCTIQNNNILKPALKKCNLFSISEVLNGVKDPTVRTFEETQRNQHSNLTSKHNQPHIEDNTKPPNNAIIITHDHHTQQSEDNEVNSSEKLNKSLCFVQETESSEMSQDKIINSDVNIQNSLLSTKCHISGVNLFVAEKDDDKKYRRTNVFIPDIIVTDLPGVSRDLTETDLQKIRHQRWHGVNGCYDSRNNWYDWTQSMELDSYGDGKTLKISPYVCIDYRVI